ncbi:inner envelope membrane protein, chloroplastic [Tetrabaena socialis]|uniref:Inner envelope membrane protein, chloroplastic n=1 Tax=Tetrabaena socialis TaxID=47790 RepID=A0A2J7ZQ60_9CHLO|nr:inner envelope membrane protein, chloroplastic [Tetrabaena socialis]|eukprot:PNH02392.1 inner envelope membrane protein, chloroplastic [Tetrabaena socialis]
MLAYGKCPLLERRHGVSPSTSLRVPPPTSLRQAPILRSAQSETYSRDVAAPRLIQHKNEAYWFYAGLSQVYDHIVNPGHWTEDMRTDALVPAKLDDPNLKVVDVGGGTGFCTLGIVGLGINPENVSCGTHGKPEPLLNWKHGEPKANVSVSVDDLGDAEDLPFPTDTFDRYVSAGSIEYWPEPQRGIKESYRVIKEGGLACMIGPVYPTFWLSRFFADVWMLFPKEEEYIEYLKNLIWPKGWEM